MDIEVSMGSLLVIGKLPRSFEGVFLYYNRKNAETQSLALIRFSDNTEANLPGRRLSSVRPGFFTLGHPALYQYHDLDK